MANSDHSAEPEAVEKPPGYSHHTIQGAAILQTDYEGKPTPEEMATLRRVPGALPKLAFLLCAVEFCERASYYGCAQIWTNYINRPLPRGGNGFGAVGIETQTQGALGLGESTANAVSQSFKMLSYTLPIVFGYLADAKVGRYNMIYWGVLVCGVAHVLIVAGGAKALLENGTAKIPFFIGVYILAIGAAMFKPCVSPLFLDQIKSHVPRVITLKSGERVIEDPEASTERFMLWFYLLINIGAFMSTATSYSAKYVGWWLAYLLPLILYFPLPLLLMWLKPRLILHPPGGSDLPNAVRVVGKCFSNGGIFRIGRAGWWEQAKPSVQAAKGEAHVETRWSDQFVEDIKRSFQAVSIFFWFPVQAINDNGIGSAAGFQGTMLNAVGVTNDVLGNFNSLSIIVFMPILNYGLYPLLRNRKISYGPIARITTAFFISTLAGLGYTLLQYYAYRDNPCGNHGSSDPRCVDEGLVSPITIWWQALPYALGGISELFINVPAYGIAYSRATANTRSVVSALNLLLSQGVFYIINLASSSVIRDPYLTWDFGGPTIAGAIVTVFFYFNFRHIDKEEYVLSTSQTSEDPDALHLVQGATVEGTGNQLEKVATNEIVQKV